jgi:pentatricopeptide repeat protein
MSDIKIKKVCNSLIDQHINRMHQLCDNGQVEDAESVYSEIRDWVIQKENLEVLSLEYISGYYIDFDKS